jgi:hypothetical protein
MDITINANGAPAWLARITRRKPAVTSCQSRVGPFFLEPSYGALALYRHPGYWGPRRVTQENIRAGFDRGCQVDSIEPATFGR